MNCKQANENISIREILESFSLFPSKENTKTAFYFAFNREERTPSLLVNYLKNIAFDFGTGKKYDNVSLVQGIKRCSVSEALQYLEQFNISFPINHKAESNEFKSKSNYKILEVKEVEHPSLIEYLQSRKLDSLKSELNEIHYELNGRKYFALGFKNDSGGYEIRNSLIKICLGKKDITAINNQSKILRIFEGFSDYLSFKVLEKTLENESSDYLILNSVSLLHKAKKLIDRYEKIELYFDHDIAGNSATIELKSLNQNASDERILYQNFKDLNEFLMNSNLRKKDTGVPNDDLCKRNSPKIGR